jgi:hypothetical protein
MPTFLRSIRWRWPLVALLMAAIFGGCASSTRCSCAAGKRQANG